MKYIALDIEGNIQSLGDCENFDEADLKTCPLGDIPAVWIWSEKDARSLIGEIQDKLQAA